MSTSTVFSINPFLIKEFLSLYSDPSSFANYQKICRDYYKLYFKLIKKYNNVPKEKLRGEVKNWFFNQSLENRIKLCTVENEFFSEIIYQMYLYTQVDSTMKFYPKAELIDIIEMDNKILFENLKENTEFELDTYFECKSEKGSYIKDYNLVNGDIYNNNEEYNDKKYNSSINEFINEIIFYSVHHKPYPDCFCLSPCFLLKEERFDTTFNFLGNINYFTSLIMPFYDNNKNIYGLHFPYWLSSSNSCSITQYIFAFIEQTIMIKFLLNNYTINKNKKNSYSKNNETEASLFSLINDDILNRFFLDRKIVINYFNMNYNCLNTKKEMVKNAKIENIFSKILKNNKIMNKIALFKNITRKKNYSGFEGSMLIQPLLGINRSNIYNTLYDDIRSFLVNNPEEQNNYLINKYISNIGDIIERNDNIIFVDNLLFQNFKGVWGINNFINSEVIEYFINIFNEQNYNDLLKEAPKKKNRKKKKKKNQNNNDNNDNDNNKENKNNENNKIIENNKNLYNFELECYNELFKDKEKLLYIPYYFNVDLGLKSKYNKIKENKLKIIEKNNKKKDSKEIFNYIKKELILKYIIDKVIHLQPDNYVPFFEKNSNEISKENIEIKINKIHGLKLRKPKKDNFLDYDNFGTITINLNNKIICDDKVNEDIDLKKEDNQIIENPIIENINKIKENKIRANSLGKKIKNNLCKNDREEKINKIIDLDGDNSSNLNIKLKEKFLENNESTNSKNQKNNKKRQKSPSIFFLFDTIKNKNKKKPKSKSPDKIKSEKKNPLEISFISSNIKSSSKNRDLHLFFMEKLHNSILKNEIKVNNILQFLTKFKNYSVEEIKKIIIKAYNNNLCNYSIDLYGSFKTGLMIEASDIDIRIKIDCPKKDLEKYIFILNDKLEEEKKFESITPISMASVPVIKLILNIEKFIDKEKELRKDFGKFKQSPIFKNFLFDKKELIQIKIDITYIINDNINNLETINKTKNDKININFINDSSEIRDNQLSSLLYIKKQLEEYPEIKPILKLLKRYFYIKKMNSSFEGGLSSYNLFLLILSYAKYQKIFNLNPYKKINLGNFLVQFLEFFGIFDFKNYLINFNSPYIYEINNNIFYNSGKSLIILDPITGENASKSSYKITEIQKMFLNAYYFFEKEKFDYENEYIKNERNDKRENDKYENILGLAKSNKHDYTKKNNKDNKVNLNIIDKFFLS